MTHSQRNITAYWDGRATSYEADRLRTMQHKDMADAWHTVWEQASAGCRASLGVPTDAPLSVLDVGTGSGNTAFVLANLGHDVHGIDLSTGMLKEATQRALLLQQDPAYTGNIPAFSCGDAHEPDFAEGSFDLVASSYVLWTLRDPKLAAQHWLRVLKPGGMVCAVDSTWFPRGVAATYAHAGKDATATQFRELYTAKVLAALPLAEATSMAASLDALRSAGLSDVGLTPLTRIYQLDSRYGVSAGHQVQMKYLVTGTKPLV